MRGIRAFASVSTGIVLFCGISLAQTASLALNKTGSSTMGGVSVGPFTATINGVSTLVISDNFIDLARPGSSWTANVGSSSNLGHATFDLTGGLKGYEEAAYLGSELLSAYNAHNTTAMGEIQYAIWAVFDPLALVALEFSNNSYYSAAESYLSGAANKSYTNFSVYTPTGLSGTEVLTLGPQVPTAEPSALLMLGFDVFFACAILLALRRYTKRHQAV